MTEVEHTLGEAAPKERRSLVRLPTGVQLWGLFGIRSRWFWVAGQLVLAAALVLLYFRVRGLTEGSPALAQRHAAEVIALEQWLGIDGALGLQHQLQQVLLSIPSAVTVANWVYIWAHWPVIIATAVWLAVGRPDVFRRLRDAMTISGAVGMVVFAAYPLAPPRLVDAGLVDTVSDQSVAYRVLQPPAFVNQYAAMPSLHVGWDLVVGLAIVAAATGVTMRTVGRLMPVVMAAATVLTANHYVLDVLAGAAFGLAGWAIALGLEKRRERRAAASARVDLRPPVPQQRPGCHDAAEPARDCTRAP